MTKTDQARPSQQCDLDWAETDYLLSCPANAKRLMDARRETRDADLSASDLGEFWERFGVAGTSRRGQRPASGREVVESSPPPQNRDVSRR